MFRQVARDYAKDHGISDAELRDQIREGKLEGVEHDGVLYVRFEVNETQGQSSFGILIFVLVFLSLVLFSIIGIWGPVIVAVVSASMYLFLRWKTSEENAGRKEETANHGKQQESTRSAGSPKAPQENGYTQNDKAESNNKRKVIACPSCNASIRIPFPARNGIGKCRICLSTFRVSVGSDGVVYVQTMEEKKAQHEELTIERCFEILSIKKDASTQEIRSAYKRVIMSYHPDRVATLGPELKIVAEQKSKQANAAFSMLKKQGYIDR